jgi:predicted DNA-binding transcriptional regulator AlpA
VSEGIAELDLTLIGHHAARWTVHDVADFLQVSVKTIYKWRLTGEGPIGARIGKHMRYDPADVVAWFESQKTAA